MLKPGGLPVGDRDYEAMRDGMLAQLEDQKMAGLGLDDLRDAMAHPKAAETVRELLPYEASAPREGDAAPDFSLPRLAGGTASAGERVTLSDHFGSRPVALIFGSYT
jgi:hypothetical protein